MLRKVINKYFHIEILNIPGPRAKKSQEIHGQIKNIFKSTPEKIYD